MERYEEYRDSEIRALGNIPKYWDITPLKWISTIIAGQSPDSSLVNETASLPFLQGKAEFGKISPVPSKWCDLPQRIAPNGSWLVSVRAPVGAVNFADREYGIGRGLCAIVPSNFVDTGYLGYCLSILDDDFKSMSTGSTFDAITSDQIGQVRIPAPTIKEQKAIATFLDEKTAEIDSLIDETEKSIELLGEYRKAVISEVVTKGLDPSVPMKDSGIEWIGEIPEHWEVKKFKYIAEVKANLVDPNEYQNYLQVSPERIEKDTAKLLDCQTVGDTGVESDNHLFFKGQLLYSKVRPALNKVTIAPFDGLCSADMYPIETNSWPNWLLYSMLSQSFVTQVRVSTDRVKMPKVNKEELGSFLLPVPPENEQRDIASFLESKMNSVDAAIEIERDLVCSLNEYRKSLISEAVTGKFKVPGVDES